VHDQLATGRKLRVLTIVDAFSRFSPALEPRFSFRGTDVVEVLERAGREVGLPATIPIDQGTEFVARDLDLWAYQRGVTLDSPGRASRPTTPSSKPSMVASEIECLNEPCGRPRKDGGLAKYYNEQQPQGAIAHTTPIMLLNHDGAASPLL
jgi:putative transposase